MYSNKDKIFNKGKEYCIFYNIYSNSDRDCEGTDIYNNIDRYLKFSGPTA